MKFLCAPFVPQFINLGTDDEILGEDAQFRAMALDLARSRHVPVFRRIGRALLGFLPKRLSAAKSDCREEPHLTAEFAIRRIAQDRFLAEAGSIMQRQMLR